MAGPSAQLAAETEAKQDVKAQLLAAAQQLKGRAAEVERLQEDLAARQHAMDDMCAQFRVQGSLPPLCVYPRACVCVYAHACVTCMSVVWHAILPHWDK